MKRLQVGERTSIVTGVVLLYSFLVLPDNAEAQRWGGRRFMPRLSMEIGIRAGYDYDADVWSVGGQFKLPLGLMRMLQIVPSGDIFFVEDKTDWQINADAAIPFPLLPGSYAGGGLAVVNRDFTNSGDDKMKTGYNLFVGMMVPFIHLPVRFYVEARWTTIGEYKPYCLVVGVNVLLGGVENRDARMVGVPYALRRGLKTK